MSIKGLEKIKEDFTVKYNIIRTKDFLVEIDEGYNLIQQFMYSTIDTLKYQSNQIADLKQRLAKKEDVIDVNEIKEVKRLNEDI